MSLVLTLAAFDEVGTVPGDRIEHGAVIPRELDATLRTMGLVVVTQPNFAAERGDEYLISVDRDDLDDLWRCSSLLEAGIAVGAGTDAPFGRPDPWALITAAVDRRTPGGTIVNPSERVDPMRALALLLGRAESPGGPIRRVGCGSAVRPVPAHRTAVSRHSATAGAVRPCRPTRRAHRLRRRSYGWARGSRRRLARGDLVPLDTELEKDLLGVLTVFGRGYEHVGLLVELHRIGDEVVVDAVTFGDRCEIAVGGNLRVVDELTGSLHRGPHTLERLQCLDPLGQRATAEDLVEGLDQLSVIVEARRHRRIAGPR